MSSKFKNDNPLSGDGASPGKIFIGGLAKDTTFPQFNKHFGKYGEIIDSVIMKDRYTGQPRGFGFITYADPSVVDKVIVEDHVINGKQVEEHYGSQGLGIVGYFHANERFDDAELGIVAKNIGDHICRYFPQAALLLLDNKKLEALPKGKDQSPLMQLYIRDASKNWKLAGPDGGSRLVIKEPAANVVLLDFISSEKWQDVVDFDDHLDNIKKDWLNPELFK